MNILFVWGGLADRFACSGEPAGRCRKCSRPGAFEIAYWSVKPPRSVLRATRAKDICTGYVDVRPPPVLPSVNASGTGNFVFTSAGRRLGCLARAPHTHDGQVVAFTCCFSFITSHIISSKLFFFLNSVCDFGL